MHELKLNHAFNEIECLSTILLYKFLCTQMYCLCEQGLYIVEGLLDQNVMHLYLMRIPS